MEKIIKNGWQPLSISPRPLENATTAEKVAILTLQVLSFFSEESVNAMNLVKQDPCQAARTKADKFNVDSGSYAVDGGLKLCPIENVFLNCAQRV